VFDPTRADALRSVLRRWPSVLVVEDDHAGPVAGAAAHTLADPARERWAVVRSASKSLGPDLRDAVLAGDATTVARVRGRQQVGPGWVSHFLHSLVAVLWSDPTTQRLLAEATHIYDRRRDALLTALAELGVPATGRSGLNVWIPVADEDAVVRALWTAGYAVAAGSRFRHRSGPAIRVTVAALDVHEAPTVAAAIAKAMAPGTTRRLA
jgi:DNA-binding transcriptional MocR family regulator